MSKIIATKEKVFEACNRLWSNRQDPTIVKVLQILGGGSRSTIVKHLQEWRNLNEQSQYENLSEPVPSEIKELVSPLNDEALATIYRRVLVEVRKQVFNEVNECHQQEIQELKEENMRIQILEAKVETIETKYTELLKQNAEINKKNGWLEKEIEELKQQRQK